MKRTFLSISIAALLSAPAALAQPVSAGLKAGVTLANFTGDLENTEMRFSYHAGMFLNAPLSNTFSIQPELLMNSVSVKSALDGVDVTFNVNYLSVPVVAVYSFGIFNVHAGPQVDFLLSAKAKPAGFGEFDVKDYFKAYDLAVNLGAGVKAGRLHASARYCLGLTNVSDTEMVKEARNSIFQVALGYTLLGGN